MTRRVAAIALLSVFLGGPVRVYAESDGQYETDAGETVSFERAWEERSERVHGPPPRVLRGTLETAVALGFGAAWYWASRDLNSADWDVRGDPASLATRFTTRDYIRFDTNRFYVNQGHLFAGATYYGIARANDFGATGSLLSATLASAAWEWIFEYREYVSLNDLITSPFGGQAVGEALYRYGELYRLQAGELSLAAKILTAPFGQLRAFHETLGDPAVESDPAYGPSMYHEFRAGVGGGARGIATGEPNGHASLMLQTLIVDMPGFRRPGRFNTYFRDGNFTFLDVGAAFDADGEVARAELDARTTFAGWYHQDVDEAGAGHSFMLGFARGAWLDERIMGPFTDRVGMVDLAGPVLATELLAGPARLRLDVSWFLDFGSVTSLAFHANRSAYDLTAIRSELAAEGTYFAWGVTGVPRVTLQAGPLRAELLGRLSSFSKVRGPDRVHADDLPVDLDLRDKRLRVFGAVGVRLVRGLELRVHLDRVRRLSAIDDFEVRRSVSEVGASVIHRF